MGWSKRNIFDKKNVFCPNKLNQKFAHKSRDIHEWKQEYCGRLQHTTVTTG